MPPPTTMSVKLETKENGVVSSHIDSHFRRHASCVKGKKISATPDLMLSPITMNNANNSSNGGEGEADYSSQNLDTSLGRETMLQLLQSRQRAMRAELERLTAQHQEMTNSLQNQQQQQQQGGIMHQNDQMMHDEDHDESHLDFHSDTTGGFQGGFAAQPEGISSYGAAAGLSSSAGGMMPQGGLSSEQIAQLTNTIGGAAASASLPFLGLGGEQSRGMGVVGDSNMEDELLRLLLARRQRLRTTAESLGHTLNPNRGLRTSESAPSSLDSGNIQSLTDELLRNYSRNRTSGLSASFLGQQDDPFQSEDDIAIGQQYQAPFPSSSAHRSSSLPASSLFQQEMRNRRELHRSSSLPASYQNDNRFPQETNRLDDLSGVIDLIDAPERIEPTPMSVQDIVMRDQLKMRDQRFADSDDRKRFLESRRSRSTGSINYGQLEGFDFGPAVNAKIEQRQGTSSPRKRKKTSPRKKPSDMPRRPLSAYNLFFSEERERILLELSDDKDPSSSDITSGEQTPSGVKSDPSSEEEDAGGEGEGDTKPPAVPSGTEATSESDDSPSKTANIQALMRPMIPSQKKRRPHRKTHGKIGFQALARMVGERWRALPEERKDYYRDLAKEDMKRQKLAMDEYYRKQEKSGGKEGTEESGKPAAVAVKTEDMDIESELAEEQGKSMQEEGKTTEDQEVIDEAIKSIEEGVAFGAVASSEQEEAQRSTVDTSKEEIDFLKDEEKETEKEEKDAEGDFDSLNMAAV